MFNLKRIIKKTVSVSLCALITVAATAVYFAPETDNALTAYAAYLEWGDYRYKVNDDGTVKITRYYGNDETVYVPEKIEDAVVTIIGENSFCDNTDMSGIVLPDTIKEIGRYAFAGCSELKTITIPSGTSDIDEGAFGFRDEEEVFLTVINGVENSAAEKFAADNEFEFVPIETDEVLPTAVRLNMSRFSLLIGESKKIEAYVYPNYSTNKTITWTSRNPNVAEVTDGEVKALSVGTTVITAETVNGLTASCRVSVKKPEVYPTGLMLDKTSISIGKGESYNLTATLKPSDATVKTVRWSSSDKNIVTVSGGKIVGKNNGTATITAWTPNGISTVCKVIVKNAPSTVSLTKTTLSLGLGESFSLSAVIPSDSAAAVRTFSASDNNVIKMTKTSWTANFTATALGTSVVTVKLYNGMTASCRVTVRSAPSKVTMSRGLLSMELNEKGKLTCSIPGDSACAVRTFRTSNSKVVKMTKTDWTGEFTAVGYGTAWVTVRTYNGKEATCKITVTRPATGIDLYITRKVMKPGQTFALKYHMRAEEYTDLVEFSSTNTKVCTVSSTGTIKAVANGTASVIAKTQNGYKAVCQVTVTTNNTIYNNAPSSKLPLYSNFKAVNQYPELPTGCEVTALTSVLNFYGYNVDKCTLADNYLPKGDAMSTDFREAFAGNPRSSYSYGCYAPVIVNTANKYLKKQGSTLTARQLSGYTFDELFKFTESGTPVLVWATMDMRQGYYSQSWTASNGKKVTWYANEHCLTLLGSSGSTVYLADPMYGTVKSYDKSLFKTRYQELFSQAVVIQ